MENTAYRGKFSKVKVVSALLKKFKVNQILVHCPSMNFCRILNYLFTLQHWQKKITQKKNNN